MNARIVALAISLTVPSMAHAWCRTTTLRSMVVGECSMQGVPLAWRSMCTGFSLNVDGSPDIALEDVRTEATAAAARWHAAPCDANGSTTPYFQLLPLQLLVTMDNADTQVLSGYNRSGLNSNTVSFNGVWHSDANHQLGTIAITLVSYDMNSGEILDADVELNQATDANPDGFHFTIGTPDPTAADLPTILTHEFGHLHGLGHSTVDTAVMWPSAGLGEQRRMLRTDDVEAICDAYNPQYAPENLTCNPTPYGGFMSNAYGGRVRGGCSVARGLAPVRSPRAGLLLLGLAAVALAARARTQSRKD